MISNKAAWVIKTVTGSGAILESIRAVSMYSGDQYPTSNWFIQSSTSFIGFGYG